MPWNSLPEDLRNFSSYNQFQQMILSWNGKECKRTACNSIYEYQRTNGPVNAYLISGATVNTKTSFAKFEIVLKLVKVNSGSSDI